MENKNYIVSRLPEFVGYDGELYNAAWGPLELSGKRIYIGNMMITGHQVEKLSFVPSAVLPKFMPRYFSTDQRMLRVYDATKA